MAGAFPQDPIDPGPEVRQHSKRHKGLHRTGKAAAMNTVSPPAIQQMVAQSKGQGHFLAGCASRRDHILQIHPGRAAAFGNQFQKRIKVTLLQGSNLAGHSGVILIEVDRPQDRPVGTGIPQFRYILFIIRQFPGKWNTHSKRNVILSERSESKDLLHYDSAWQIISTQILRRAVACSE